MPKHRTNLLVCSGSGCVAAKSLKIKDAIKAELIKQGIGKEVNIILSGCSGFCPQGPVINIQPDGIFYHGLKLDDVPYLVQEHFVKGRPVEKFMYKEPVEKQTVPSMKDIPFFKHQVLRVLKNKGLINPEVIDEYIARDGYSSLAKALTEMSPEEIRKAIKDSGIRGRGGAGFPVGLKWEACAKTVSDQKYMLCNGSAAIKDVDRALMEADPHAVIEGMIIGAKAIGASKGYVYVKADYPIAVSRLKIAIDQCYEAGLLGKNILDSGFDFDLEIFKGGGAFICGESTALISSMEGKRGMPRLMPPRSAEAGLWGKPTVLNNAETLAYVAQIVLNGPEWFRSLGTETNPGTKVFSLTGSINNRGFVEVPLGIPLKKILNELGGGMPRGKKFKAVHIGGPTGGTLPESLLDIPLDYESIAANGAVMGSGGLVFMDESSCMVSMAKFFLDFIVDESCGKCPPCRIGTRVMLDTLTDITEGRGKEADIETLLELSSDMIDGSLCGFGQMAPNPVMTSIKYFRQEYDSHIKDKWCKAGVCRDLCSFHIIEKLCKGCGACIRVCPSKAIIGEKKKPHKIIREICINCGSCFKACKFKSIKVLPAKYEGDPEDLVEVAAPAEKTKGGAK